MLKELFTAGLFRTSGNADMKHNAPRPLPKLTSSQITFYFPPSIWCVLVSASTLEILLWDKPVNQMIREGISILSIHRPLLSHGEEYLSHGKAGVQKRKIFIYVISQAFGAAYISNFVSFAMTLGGSEIRCLKSYGI